MSILTEEQLITLSRRDLQRECRKVNLTATGTTNKMRHRLRMWKLIQAKKGGRQRQTTVNVVTTEDVVCPITLELPCDPVTAEDGRVYERAAIERHFQARQQKGLPLMSPTTNVAMGDRLVPAPHHKNAIETLIQNGSICGSLADEWKTHSKVKQLAQALFFKQAEQGSVRAMEVIGVCCLQGTGGFPKDFYLSYHWSKKAHHAGSVFGTALLGHHLCTGLGTQKYIEQGIMYTSAAAARGSDLGEYCLGMALADGKYGLPKNPVEAGYWLQKSLVDRPSQSKKMGPKMKTRVEKKIKELLNAGS